MKRSIKSLFLILLVPFCIPQNLKMPVEKATTLDYNHHSFWCPNWGSSIVHKGIDIFASKGTRVKSSTVGLVLNTLDTKKGGKCVLVLGPKWRLHYYAHLDKICTTPFSYVTQEDVIGLVGNTGNAGKSPSHLHYSIASLIPYPWKLDRSKQGWKKMFYLNPHEYLTAQNKRNIKQ